MLDSPQDGPSPSALAHLRASLGALEELCEKGTLPRVRDLLDQSGAAHGAALPAIVLALPFLTPVSLGVMTAPASAVICLCGLAVARNSAAAPLPTRLLDASIPAAAVRVMRAALDRVHRWILHVSRPRLQTLVRGRAGRLTCGLGMILGALLLAVPIPFLPLTNTFPALGIICIGLGWSERDGAITVAGFVALLASIVTFAVIGAGIWLAAGELPLG